MKNFMKKTAFAALAALMALSAVSCGKTADGDGAETTAAQSGDAKAEPIVVQTNAYFSPFEYFEGNDIVGCRYRHHEQGCRKNEHRRRVSEC